jgi:hypothetical protein
LIVTLGTVYCHRESLRETTHSILLQHYFFETLSYEYLRTCDQVRSYRTQRNVSDRALLTLEYRYCVQEDPYYSRSYRRVNPNFVSLPPNYASQDCIDATVLARLAIAEDPYGRDTSEITGFQQILCTLPASEFERNTTLEWRNGRTAKFGDSWYYPNGNNAKFGDTWYYPNGKNAKFGNTWYYPNGRNAKFGSSWYYPDGDRTDLASLLSWSCGVLTYFDCQERLADLRSTEGFWYDLTVIELSSRASQEIDYYRRYDYRSRPSGNPDIDIDIIIKRMFEK